MRDMRTTVRAGILVATAALALAAAATGAGKSPGDWPAYRGAAGDGISLETGLAKSWPAAGPKVLWTVPLGDGYSGISVVGRRLFTMYSRDGSEWLAAFDASTGAPAWSQSIDRSFTSDMGDGPRSTPTVDGDAVYGLSAGGTLVAAKSSSGEILWKKDLKVEVQARVPTWGISTSPVVEGELLVLDAGGPSGKSLVALNRKTGQVAWTAHDDRPGYSTPLAVTIDATRQILSFPGSSLVSVSPTDGKVLWSVPWKTSYDVNAAMPVFIPPDKVFVSSSYDTGGAVYQVRKRGQGLEAVEVWRNRNMKNHFNSSIHSGGFLYGFDDNRLKCLDAATGEERWRQTGFRKGSIVLADGHLIVFSEDGLLALVEATPEAYREKARAQILSDRTWTMPTLAGGRLYLRNRKEMVALDLKS